MNVVNNKRYWLHNNNKCIKAWKLADRLYTVTRCNPGVLLLSIFKRLDAVNMKESTTDLRLTIPTQYSRQNSTYAFVNFPRTREATFTLYLLFWINLFPTFSTLIKPLISSDSAIHLFFKAAT